MDAKKKKICPQQTLNLMLEFSQVSQRDIV